MIGYIKNKLFTFYVFLYAAWLNGEAMGEILARRYIVRDLDEQRLKVLKETIWDTSIIAAKAFWRMLLWPMFKLYVGFEVTFGVIFLILNTLIFLFENDKIIETTTEGVQLLHNTSVNFHEDVLI